MDSAVRWDFFLTSRDRVRRNDVYDTLVDSITDDLRDHQGLKELNAQRRKKQIERAVSDDKETANIFSELLKSDPTLSALFSLGDRLVTSTGPGLSAPFVGRQFPTFFRISNEPKQGLLKECPINRTCSVVFETDAANDYFERADCRGEITTDPPSLIEHSHLWNGAFTAKVAVPWNLEPGQQVKVTVHVTDVQAEHRSRPFKSIFTIIATDAIKATASAAPSGRRRTSQPHENGKATSPKLAIPEVLDENRPNEKYSALRISHNDNGGYDFYLNVDNAFLLTEMTRAKADDKPLVKFWFKYGLALCALGMIQESKRREVPEKGEETDGEGTPPSDGDDLKRVATYCNGVARVIVPVIRALYRGPQAANN